MKFLIFAYANKHYTINFTEWFVTQIEVDEMIDFFYSIDYLKFKYNPVNMLYFYLVDGNFMEFTELMIHYPPTNPDAILMLKQKFIIPSFVITHASGGGGGGALPSPIVDLKSNVLALPADANSLSSPVNSYNEIKPNIIKFITKKGGKRKKHRGSRKNKKRSRKNKTKYSRFH